MSKDELEEMGIKRGHFKKWQRMMQQLGAGAQDDHSPAGLLGKLSQFWAKMQEHGWDDPSEWHNMSKQDLEAVGFKAGHLGQWNQVLQKLGHVPLLTLQEKDLLREVCLELVDFL